MITVRIRFEKTGEAAYISLLDLQRVFHRILKRSGLPVYYTQGFNPHIYLSFACPLSLGQESLCECCEVKTEAEDPQLDTWCDVLQPYMPRGIKVLSAQQAQNKVAEIDHASYLVTLPASAAAALDAYNAAENAMVVKKTKRGQKELDLKTIIPHVEYEQAGEQLQFNHHRRQQAAIGAGTPGAGKAHQTGAKVDNDDLQHQRRAADDPHKGFDHAPQRCEPAHGAK